MPISPTNISKNTISPVGAPKAKVASWGDSLATWGDAVFAWGFGSESFTNINKSSVATFLELENATHFLLESGVSFDLEGGNGSLSWTNVTKN